MLENDADKCDPIKRKCIFADTNPFFFLGLLMVSLSEANLIHKLWIKPKFPVDPITAFGLQFVFLMPFLFISIFWYRIDKHQNKEEISPSFAESPNSGLLILLSALYFIMFPLFLSFVTR